MYFLFACTQKKPKCPCPCSRGIINLTFVVLSNELEEINPIYKLCQPLLPSFCLTSVIGSRYAYTPHRERIYTYIQRAFSGLYQIGLVPSVHPVKDCYLSYQTKCYFQDGPMYFFWKLQWESRSLLRAQIQASVSIFRDVNKGKRKKIYQVSGKGAVFAPLRYMSKF